MSEQETGAAAPGQAAYEALRASARAHGAPFSGVPWESIDRLEPVKRADYEAAAQAAIAAAAPPDAAYDRQAPWDAIANIRAVVLGTILADADPRRILSTIAGLVAAAAPQDAPSPCPGCESLRRQHAETCGEVGILAGALRRIAGTRGAVVDTAALWAIADDALSALWQSPQSAPELAAAVYRLVCGCPIAAGKNPLGNWTCVTHGPTTMIGESAEQPAPELATPSSDEDDDPYGVPIVRTGKPQIWTIAAQPAPELAMLRADLADAEAQLAKWPKCPAGCNCRIGTDDADRLECGCDGPCNGGEQPAPELATVDLHRWYAVINQPDGTSKVIGHTDNGLGYYDSVDEWEAKNS